MPDRDRRRVLRATAVAGLGALAGCAGGDGDTTGDATTGDGDTTGDATTGDGDTTGDATTGDGETTGEGTTEAATDTTGSTFAAPDVGTVRVADGFTAPVAYETPPGSSDPGYVVDQTGLVHRVSDGSVAEEPFLDLRDRLVSISTSYDERGLLGLAFHPDYDANGRLYVRYSAPLRDGAPSGYSHTFVLSEFVAADDATVPVDSERRVLELDQPQRNHNAGDVAFGPDGNLFVPTGDGGGAGDSSEGHVEDWYDAVDGGNGQDTAENLLGSVLRIDVDGRDGDRGYAVPDDNPLVGEDGLDEHYAWGLRNPWRVAVDEEVGLVAADVGQNRWEEIDVVRRGGNYGWNVREGRHCYGADSCPTETEDGDPLVDPVVEYAHDAPSGPSGQAVVGGHVYRGEGVPALRGRYVFTDWNAGGRLFVADPGGDRWPVAVVRPTAVEGAGPGQYVLGFGRDGDGEVYVCSTHRAGPSGASGALHRLAAP